MAEKLTPTQRLKLAEAEIEKLKKLTFKMSEEHQRELNVRLAEIQNQQYTLGYNEGFEDGRKIAAAQRAEAGIARFFKK